MFGFGGVKAKMVGCGIAAAFAFACSASHASAPGIEMQTGVASYYADHFAGKRTANGEAYNPKAFTAAHRTLPFGSKVRVTDMDSGKSVVVRINDRGPWGRTVRLIDLSRAAASELGLIRKGHGKVRLTEVVETEADVATDAG